MVNFSRTKRWERWWVSPRLTSGKLKKKTRELPRKQNREKWIKYNCFFFFKNVVKCLQSPASSKSGKQSCCFISIGGDTLSTRKMSFHHAKKVRISNNVTLNQLFVKPSFFPSKQSTLSWCQSFGFFCVFLDILRPLIILNQGRRTVVGRITWSLKVVVV